MSGKAFFIDTTRCMACRGCQIACKQWNKNPATKTEQWGSHQNPKDLSWATWKLIRFNETVGPEGKTIWYFFADQCRHCLDPPCLESATDVKGAIVIDKATGAVIHTKKLSKIQLAEVQEACPFNIPRANPKTKIYAKCTMCLDRLTNNQIPACVKACPTGTMVFGERGKILEEAKKRVATLKKTFPNVAALNADDVRVIFIVKDDPKKYYEFAAGK